MTLPNQTLETEGTRYMTVDGFMDAFANLRPGQSLVYAFGDIGYSSRYQTLELVGLKGLAFRYYQRKLAQLIQRRRPDVSFGRSCGASFEYIITKNRDVA